MRKIGTLLGIILMLGSLTVNGQKAIKNGFGLNLIVGIPSSTYGLDIEATDVPDDIKLGTTFGLQIGNRWYFSPTDQFGVGLMVNWFDITWGGKSADLTGTSVTRGVLDLSFLEFGPVGTFALSDDMAVDAYYNLRPTFILSAYATTIGNGEIANVTAGVGMSHGLGAAFRYKVFNVGLEYVFGGVTGATTSTTTGDVTATGDIDDIKVNTGSIRLNLGFKF